MRPGFVNKKAAFPAGSGETLPESMRFVESVLREMGTDRKLMMQTLVIVEETAALLLEQADPGTLLHVQVRKHFGDAVISLRAAGRELDPFGENGMPGAELGQMEDEDAQRAIRSILLKSQGEKIKFSYTKGINRVRIQAGAAERSMLTATAAALVLGLFFGLLMNVAFPSAFSEAVCTFVLDPVRTMFMNVLKMIIAPVVFFSIVSCFSQFNDLTELGRIGAKIMGMYIATTVIAVSLGVGISLLLHPGEWGFALSLDVGAGGAGIRTDVDTSLLNTIVNIVPSNFLRPFLEANTLQIIFMAVLCGTAVGMIGEYSSILKDFFEACNSLFLTITSLAARFIPAAVFCSSALLLRQMGGTSLLALMGMCGTVILCILCMLLAYGLLILALARLNPLTFYKKNREGMLTSFTLCSSSAAMPVNMKTCTDKLGISPKVCSFSIPLGATVNMDGGCIMMAVSGLFLARAYGVAVPGSALASLAVTIILLSLGSPGVPGAGLICIGIVLGSIGVPVEALGLVIGVYPFLDMFITMSNTTGDVAAALIVAKNEGLLDLQKFKENRT